MLTYAIENLFAVYWNTEINDMIVSLKISKI